MHPKSRMNIAELGKCKVKDRKSSRDFTKGFNLNRRLHEIDITIWQSIFHAISAVFHKNNQS